MWSGACEQADPNLFHALQNDEYDATLVFPCQYRRLWPWYHAREYWWCLWGVRALSLPYTSDMLTNSPRSSLPFLCRSTSSLLFNTLLLRADFLFSFFLFSFYHFFVMHLCNINVKFFSYSFSRLSSSFIFRQERTMESLSDEIFLATGSDPQWSGTVTFTKKMLVERFNFWCFIFSLLLFFFLIWLQMWHQVSASRILPHLSHSVSIANVCTWRRRTSSDLP